jgi:hypothetical protein
MKALIACIAVVAIAAPAFAQQPSDTLKEVTTKGIVLSGPGFEFEVMYKPDGTFVVSMPGDAAALATGKWRIDGDKLCTAAEPMPEECVAYPKGKKSGDTFDVTGAQGTGTVKIK